MGEKRTNPAQNVVPQVTHLELVYVLHMGTKILPPILNPV